MPATQQAPLPIIVSPRGRLANRMFQYMLAMRIAERVGPRAAVHGPGIDEWGLPAAPVAQAPASPLVLRGHLFDLDEVAHFLRTGLCGAVVIDGWGMRTEYHPDPAPFRRIFRSPEKGQPIGDDEIAVNVRAEDVESGQYPGYYPLPFDFYDALVRAEGNKRLVFMGQTDPSPYTNALRRRFPDARYLPTQGALSDFQTLRHARCIGLSISSFAWLASWLSESAQTIHMPVAGLFDPHRSQQNLLDVSDARFRYWSVDFPHMSERAGLVAADWAAAPRQVAQRDQAWAAAIARTALTRRIPPHAIKTAR